MRLRQICLVAHDLDKVTDDLCTLFNWSVCYRDPQVGLFGLHNALMPVGNDFIEVVAPNQDNTAAGRFLDRRQGDGGYMVILQSEDGLKYRGRAKAKNIRTILQLDEEPHIATQYHPRDVGGCILEIDSMTDVPDHLVSNANWEPAGREWMPQVNLTRVTAMTAASLQSDEPGTMAQTYADIMDRPVLQNGTGSFSISLDGAQLHFVLPKDDRGAGLAELTFICSDRTAILETARTRNLAVSGNTVEVCGMRIYLE